MTQESPPLACYPQEWKSVLAGDISTSVFMAALFARGKLWKLSKCLSTDEWIKKMGCVHSMEYYSTLKRMRKFCDIQQHGWTLKTYCWVEWVSHRRTNTASFHLHEESKIVPLFSIRVRWWLLREREMGCCYSEGLKIHLCKTRKF